MEEETKEARSVWEYTEAAPPYAEAVAELWSWSLNYGAADPANPWALFLDLIGWSDEHYGERISTWSADRDTLSRMGYRNATFSLGWVELDKLGRAMCAYADRPRDLDEWLSGLMECGE